MKSATKKRVIAGVAIVLGGYLMVAAIFALRAELAWRQAVSFRTSGDVERAVRAVRGVFDLYVPGNPRLEEASRLIWNIAMTEEKRGDHPAALAHYRILRSAWIGAHPIEGDRGWIARTEPRIARLSAEPTPDVPALAKRSRAQREAQALAEMRAPRRPYGAWGAVAALGFAGWVGATVGLIVRGFRADGTLVPGAVRWVLGLVVGYGVWILGCLRA